MRRSNASARERYGRLAAVTGQAGRPADGIALLDGLPAGRVAAHQPFWAVRAHLQAMLGEAAAAGSYRRAAGLSQEAAVRDWLLARITP